jgi:hypothetical protein
MKQPLPLGALLACLLAGCNGHTAPMNVSKHLDQSECARASGAVDAIGGRLDRQHEAAAGPAPISGNLAEESRATAQAYNANLDVLAATCPNSTPDKVAGVRNKAMQVASDTQRLIANRPAPTETVIIVSKPVEYIQ